MTLKLKSTTNELWKGWKLARYHHFTHIACAKKLRGLSQKLDALRVQNGQSLSKYQGFGRELICYTGTSMFLNLYELQPIFAFSMHLSKRPHQFPTRSDIICCFSVIYRFVYGAKWRWNWKSLQNELWKCWYLAWYHHFTRIACAKE